MTSYDNFATAESNLSVEAQNFVISLFFCFVYGLFFLGLRYCTYLSSNAVCVLWRAWRLSSPQDHLSDTSTESNFFTVLRKLLCKHLSCGKSQK